MPVGARRIPLVDWDSVFVSSVVVDVVGTSDSVFSGGDMTESGTPPLDGPGVGWAVTTMVLSTTIVVTRLSSDLVSDARSESVVRLERISLRLEAVEVVGSGEKVPGLVIVALVNCRLICLGKYIRCRSTSALAVEIRAKAEAKAKDLTSMIPHYGMSRLKTILERLQETSIICMRISISMGRLASLWQQVSRTLATLTLSGRFRTSVLDN
jgi:hypothetical protein